MSNSREAWITGVGLATSLGEGADAHLAALSNGSGAKIDATKYAPYAVHPMASLEFDKQVPKREQRQMEPWQRYGTYAAGLALESAGLKGNTELLSQTHMICAAGGGERDNDVDLKILAGLKTAADRGKFLNERLSNDLRPTLFLAQLSNLLAGNISIVHGVVGSSRTFMGEEQSGVDAVRIALSRLQGGTGDLFLVGGSFNAEREDMLLLFELGKSLLHGPFAPVWSRKAQGGGIVLGSLAAFLVIEERAHAEARGAKPFAKLTAVRSGRTRRNPGDVEKALGEQLDSLGALKPGAAIISGATGVEPATSEEHAALAKRGVPVRGHRDRVRRRHGRTVPGRPGAGRDLPVQGHDVPADRGQRHRDGAQRTAEAGRRHLRRPLAWRGRRAGRGCRLNFAAAAGVAAPTSNETSRNRTNAQHVASRFVLRQGNDMAVERRDKKGRPQVAITGMGVITPLGQGKTDNWAALLAGKSGLRTITRFPLDGLKTTVAGTIDFVPAEPFCAAELTEQLAYRAVEEAIAEAAIGSKGNFPGPLFLASPADRGGDDAPRGDSRRRAADRADHLRQSHRRRRQRQVPRLERPLPVWRHRRPAGGEIRHHRLADHAVNGVRLRRFGPSARRRSDPPRRNLCSAVRRLRRLGEHRIAGALLAALGALHRQ